VASFTEILPPSKEIASLSFGVGVNGRTDRQANGRTTEKHNASAPNGGSGVKYKNTDPQTT